MVHGERPAAPGPPLRPGRRGPAASPGLPAVRRDRPGPAPAARRAVGPQCRAHRPARRRGPVRLGGGDPRRMASRGRRRPRRRAGDMGADPGLHRPRRRRQDPPRLLRARRRRGVRPRPHPPARAHAPGAQGGPAAPHPARRRPTSRPSSPCTPTRTRVPGRPSSRSPPASRGRSPPTTTARPAACGASPTQTPSRPSRDVAREAELLIADGHHRYETARVYADEIGGEAGTASC